MDSHHLRNNIGRIFLALTCMAGIGVASSNAVQAQRPTWDSEQDRIERARERERERNRRNRDYRRDDDRYSRNGTYGGYGGYGNVSQVAINQGYQDGLNTGANDAQRRQSFDPQRSHFYR